MFETIENTLTKASCIPVIGAIPAAVKIVMGTAEVVAGVATSILAVFATIFTASRYGPAVIMGGIVFAGRGLANIVAGILEAIPLVGTASAFYLSTNGTNPMHLITGKDLI